MLKIAQQRPENTGIARNIVNRAESLSKVITAPITSVMQTLSAGVDAVTLPVVTTLRDGMHKLWNGEASENPADYEAWAKQGQVGSAFLFGITAFFAKNKLTKKVDSSVTSTAMSAMFSLALSGGVWVSSRTDERLYALQACEGMLYNAKNLYEACSHEKAKIKLHALARELIHLDSDEEEKHQKKITTLKKEMQDLTRKVDSFQGYLADPIFKAAFEIAQELSKDTSHGSRLTGNQLLEILHASGKEAGKMAELLVLMSKYIGVICGSNDVSSIVCLFDAENLRKIQQNALVLVRSADNLQELGRLGVLDYDLLNFIISHSEDRFYLEESINRVNAKEDLHHHRVTDYLLASFRRFSDFKQSHTDVLAALEKRNQDLIPQSHAMFKKSTTTDLEKDKTLSADIKAAYIKIKASIAELRLSNYEESYRDFNYSPAWDEAYDPDRRCYRRTSLPIFSEKQFAKSEAIAKKLENLQKQVDKRISRAELPPETTASVSHTTTTP